MKIVTVIGARPQFIKAVVVSAILSKKHHEVLVHTGQHYDSNMSDIFFEELKIQKPDYNLKAGSASHAKQTAYIMVGVEEILLKERPDCLMVYGDTNSTLAGAIAASKLLIPVIHIEAGLRSFNIAMPEEQNRILTDRISKYLFCPTQSAVENLKNEGIVKGVYNVGDVMCDAVMYYSKSLNKYSKKYFFNRFKGIYGAIPQIEEWYLATVHRQENTDSIDKINEILAAFEKLDAPVIFPVHPRSKPLVTKLNNKKYYRNILFIEPIGYLDMLYLTKNAKKVITDSGGLQKEAYMLSTPCITVRDETEWIETLRGDHNILAKPQCDDILSKILHTKIDFANKQNYFGQGDAAEKICNILN